MPFSVAAFTVAELLRNSVRSRGATPLQSQIWYWLTAKFCLVAMMLLTLQPLHASDVDLPVVEPLHTIFVEAETVAKEVRGIYDVLAFEGKCVLKQGELQTTGDRITLWIERRNQLGMELPGKIICQVDGRAEIRWNNVLRLSDQRWMGRLFSLKPVDFRVQREVKRHDIPNLDWSSVQQAQYSQNSGNGQVLAPPLLGDTQNTTAGTGQLPQPIPPKTIPTTPGAVQWNQAATQVPPAFCLQRV